MDEWEIISSEHDKLYPTGSKCPLEEIEGQIDGFMKIFLDQAQTDQARQDARMAIRPRIYEYLMQAETIGCFALVPEGPEGIDVRLPGQSGQTLKIGGDSTFSGIFKLAEKSAERDQKLKYVDHILKALKDPALLSHCASMIMLGGADQANKIRISFYGFSIDWSLEAFDILSKTCGYKKGEPWPENSPQGYLEQSETVLSVVIYLKRELGHSDEVLRLEDEFIVAFPDSDRSHIRRATELFRNQNVDAALKYLQEKVSMERLQSKDNELTRVYTWLTEFKDRRGPDSTGNGPGWFFE
jgi:hypothetical protein